MQSVIPLNIDQSLPPALFLLPSIKQNLLFGKRSLDAPQRGMSQVWTGLK